jgi:lysophospholipase L1-like esterase
MLPFRFLRTLFHETKYLLIVFQFGHNDQKATANISIEEYSANLKELASEAKAAGATPVYYPNHANHSLDSDS